MGQRPVLVMDEAGNTGENLLDVAQPVYALAGIRVEPEAASRAVNAALNRTQMSELKFSRLRTSNPGRSTILSLLRDLYLTSDEAAVTVVHKPWIEAPRLCAPALVDWPPQLTRRCLRRLVFLGCRLGFASVKTAQLIGDRRLVSSAF